MSGTEGRAGKRRDEAREQLQLRAVPGRWRAQTGVQAVPQFQPGTFRAVLGC